MSFKILSISSMYSGYLEYVDLKFPYLKKSSYSDHYNFLLNDSTEFTASYTRAHKKLGIDAAFILWNNNILQKQWKLEKGIRYASNQQLLFAQVKDFKPDILLIEDLRFLDNHFLKEIRKETRSIRVIIAYHCSSFFSDTIRKLKDFDFVLTCTPGLKGELERLGIRTYLVYHGFDSDILLRINESNLKTQNDVLFSGSLFQGYGAHSERIELISKILRSHIALSLYLNLEKDSVLRVKQLIYSSRKFFEKARIDFLLPDFKIFERLNTPVVKYPDEILKVNHGPVFGLEMYKLLSGARIILNNHGEIAGNFAGNMRMFEATGVGACLLTDNKTNMDQLFEKNIEVVVYESIDDCIEKARWLLANENERIRIGLSGQKRTFASHTITNRCQQIIEIIEKELNGL